MCVCVCVCRDVSVELPLVLMHPKPAHQPETPQKSKFYTQGHIQLKRKKYKIHKIHFSFVAAAVNIPVDTNLIELNARSGCACVCVCVSGFMCVVHVDVCQFQFGFYKAI